MEPKTLDDVYAVNYWGSKPGTDDDCYTGIDFDTRKQAEEAFEAPVSKSFNTCVAWVELDGPDVHKERQNPDYRPQPDNDDDWRREIAMQAGMGLGIQAYNDYMGF